MEQTLLDCAGPVLKNCCGVRGNSERVSVEVQLSSRIEGLLCLCIAKKDCIGSIEIDSSNR